MNKIFSVSLMRVLHQGKAGSVIQNFTWACKCLGEKFDMASPFYLQRHCWTEETANSQNHTPHLENQVPRAHSAIAPLVCPLSTCPPHIPPTSAPCFWLSQAGTPQVLLLPSSLDSRDFCLPDYMLTDTQPADLGNQQKQIGWGAPRKRRLPPSSLTDSFSTQLHNSVSLGQLFPGRACRALTTCKKCFSARCCRGLPGTVPAAQRLFCVLTWGQASRHGSQRIYNRNAIQEGQEQRSSPSSSSREFMQGK